MRSLIFSAIDLLSTLNIWPKTWPLIFCYLFTPITVWTFICSTDKLQESMCHVDHFYRFSLHSLLPWPTNTNKYFYFRFYAALEPLSSPLSLSLSLSSPVSILMFKIIASITTTILLIVVVVIVVIIITTTTIATSHKKLRNKTNLFLVEKTASCLKAVDVTW